MYSILEYIKKTKTSNYSSGYIPYDVKTLTEIDKTIGEIGIPFPDVRDVDGLMDYVMNAGRAAARVVHRNKYIWFTYILFPIKRENILMSVIVDGDMDSDDITKIRLREYPYKGEHLMSSERKYQPGDVNYSKCIDEINDLLEKYA